MITGQEKPDSGEIRIGDTVKIGYVDQSRDSLDPNKTVWEEISGGNEVLKLGKHEVNSRAYVGSFQLSARAINNKRLALFPAVNATACILAKMLKSGSNVLLLDEPTNDLDTETLSALEDALEDFAGCAVIISHDRMFLDQACHPHAGLSKATAMWNGLKATSKIMKKTNCQDWATTRSHQNGSTLNRWGGDRENTVFSR